jgi:hypothetical protein
VSRPFHPRVPLEKGPSLPLQTDITAGTSRALLDAMAHEWLPEGQMHATDQRLVCVQREWNGWQTAEVRLGDLQDFHWLQPGHAPRPILHGYVSCANIITGEIPHHCERSKGPHTLLVCVLKKHSAPSVYAEIARRADEQRLVGPSPLVPAAARIRASVY